MKKYVRFDLNDIPINTCVIHKNTGFFTLKRSDSVVFGKFDGDYTRSDLQSDFGNNIMFEYM